MKHSRNITAHTRNRPPLEVIESKSFMDRYLSPKLHSSKKENSLKTTVDTTFPAAVPNIKQEELR